MFSMRTAAAVCLDGPARCSQAATGNLARFRNALVLAYLGAKSSSQSAAGLKCVALMFVFYFCLFFFLFVSLISSFSPSLVRISLMFSLPPSTHPPPTPYSPC